jgi:hypothetical protein
MFIMVFHLILGFLLGLSSSCEGGWGSPYLKAARSPLFFFPSTLDRALQERDLLQTRRPAKCLHKVCKLCSS